MFVSFNRLRSADLMAKDGKIGHAADLFFDERNWRVCYLVVDTGDWLSRRLVTLPIEVCHDAGGERITVDLTREAVRSSPDIEAHQPISRARELELAEHFEVTPRWLDLHWFDPTSPGHPAKPDTEEVEEEARREELIARAASEDNHLRSAREIEGYRVRARDGEIGHVVDFLIDDQSWTVHHLVVHTGGWLSSRSTVLAPRTTLSIDWKHRQMTIDMTRAQIEQGPRYDAHEPIDPEREHQILEYYKSLNDLL